MRTLLFLMAIIGSTLLASIVIAENKHANTMNHAMHTQEAETLNANIPTEAGQAGFAAIAEIVTLLSNDPRTDWEKVDIKALRKHLVDMNNLTLNANVVMVANEASVVFNVSGSDETLRAIQAMVPAHANVLTTITNWETDTKLNKNGVTFSLISNDSHEIKKIIGLGFFGVMATGAHHQKHHLQIAKGNNHFH